MFCVPRATDDRRPGSPTRIADQDRRPGSPTGIADRDRLGLDPWLQPLVPSDPSSAFAILAGDLEALLGEVLRARGVAARRYALEMLEQGLLLADPGMVRPDEADRARALGASPEVLDLTARSAPAHAVRIPLVDVASGRALVRTFYASFDAAPVASKLGPESEHALREAFDLSRRLAKDPRVRPIRWVAAQPRALERIVVVGESLAAGALVSAYALLTGRAVRPGLVVTGTLRGAALGPVGHLDLKLQAIAKSGASAAVVPKGERRSFRPLRIHAVGSVQELLDAAMDPTPIDQDPDALLDQARAQVRLGWRGFRWPEALELLERAALVVPEQDVDSRVELLARLGAAERHAGSLLRSKALLTQAVQLSKNPARDGVTDASRSVAFRNQAMTLLSLGESTSAARASKRGLRAALRGHARREELKALSVEGLVARGRRDEAHATHAFSEALGIDLALNPHRVARSRAYLAESLARTGKLAAARHQYQQALEECRRRDSRSDEAWVRTAFGSGLVSRRRFAEAREVLDAPAVLDAIAHQPLPGLRARRLLGAALLADPKSRARGAQLLFGALPSLALEPGLRRHAALCLLVAARDAEAGDTALEQALGALSEGRHAGDARALRDLPASANRKRQLDALIAGLDRLP